MAAFTCRGSHCCLQLQAKREINAWCLTETAEVRGNSCLILSDLSKVWGIYLFLIPPGHENVQWVVLIIWLLTLETFLNIKVSKEMKKRVKMILFHWELPGPGFTSSCDNFMDLAVLDAKAAVGMGQLDTL